MLKCRLYPTIYDCPSKPHMNCQDCEYKEITNEITNKEVQDSNVSRNN